MGETIDNETRHLSFLPYAGILGDTDTVHAIASHVLKLMRSEIDSSIRNRIVRGKWDDFDRHSLEHIRDNPDDFVKAVQAIRTRHAIYVQPIWNDIDQVLNPNRGHTDIGDLPIQFRISFLRTLVKRHGSGHVPTRLLDQLEKDIKSENSSHVKEVRNKLKGYLKSGIINELTTTFEDAILLGPIAYRVKTAPWKTNKNDAKRKLGLWMEGIEEVQPKSIGDISELLIHAAIANDTESVRQIAEKGEEIEANAPPSQRMAHSLGEIRKKPEAFIAVVKKIRKSQ